MGGHGAGTTWCPNASCRAALPPGAATCPECGLVLTGPDAERLREVDRELAGLWAESQRLTRLLLPEVGPAPAADQAPTAAAVPRRSPSAQQLLLGLGAVLTLSAAGFFLFVVWDLIGPAGQLLAVSALIGAAAWSSYAACRRRLAAAAETAAVLVAGLTVLVLAAAYGLGWLGVDGLTAGTYGALAALVTAALLLGVDRGVPAGQAIRTYRPTAALAFGLAPWLAYAGLVPPRAEVAAVVGLLAVAVVDAAGAVAALRLDRRRTRPGPPATAVLLGAGAALAYTVHLLRGWSIGYDDAVDVGSRVTIAGVLLLGPVLVAVASTRPPPGPASRRHFWGGHLWGGHAWGGHAWGGRRTWARATALALAAPALGILLTDLPSPALVVVTTLFAGASLAAALDHRPLAPGWRRAGTAFVALALPVLVLLVLGLDAADQDTAFQGFQGSAGDGPGVVASTSVALLWAVAASAGAVRARAVAATPPPRDAPGRAAIGIGGALLVAQVAVAEVAWALAAGRLLVEVDSVGGWLAGGLLALAVNLVVAAALVRRAPVGPRGSAIPVELVLLLSAAAGGLVAVTAADARGDGSLAATLIGAGVAVLAYAALPGRLPFSYLGAVSVSLGSRVLVEDAGITAVEATTLPLAALLAGIGLVQARRRAGTPTMLVAGPALSVALVPTLVVALERGDDVRLALVTGAALTVLVLGLWRQWRAPVTAGAAVLVVVAVTQGGPLVGRLPTVLVLGVAGGALLAIGVAWERAVLAGRRASAWYASLR